MKHILALFLTVNAVAATELITPIYVSSSTASTDLAPASRLIDNSGMSAPLTTQNNYYTNQVSPATSGWWQTETTGNINFFKSSHPKPTLLFDLGKDYVINEFVFWGFNREYQYQCVCEAKSFTMRFMNEYHSDRPILDQTIDVSSSRPSYVTANQSRISIPLITARYVWLTPTANWGGASGLYGESVALGEVRFLGEVAAIPEVPYGALSMGALAAIAVVARRKKNK